MISDLGYTEIIWFKYMMAGFILSLPF